MQPLSPEDERYITVRGQLIHTRTIAKRDCFPLVFCRECGQEYYSVYLRRDAATGKDVLMPRDLQSNRADNEGDPGFLYLNTRYPWPNDPDEVIARVPDDWIEEPRGSLRIRYSQRKNLPSQIRVGADARETQMALFTAHSERPFGSARIAALPTEADRPMTSVSCQLSVPKGEARPRRS